MLADDEVTLRPCSHYEGVSPGDLPGISPRDRFGRALVPRPPDHIGHLLGRGCGDARARIEDDGDLHPAPSLCGASLAPPPLPGRGARILGRPCSRCTTP